MRTAVLLWCILAATVICVAPPHGRKVLPDDHPMHTANHSLALPIPHVSEIKPRYLNKYLRPKRTAPKRFWAIVLYTRWCHVCDQFVDPITELASHYSEAKDRVAWGKMDVTEDLGPAHKFGVDDFPTLALFDNEEIKISSKFAGERTVEAIKAWIETETSVRL